MLSKVPGTKAGIDAAQLPVVPVAADAMSSPCQVPEATEARDYAGTGWRDRATCTAITDANTIAQPSTCRTVST